ncbi:hypothetical protein ACFSE1_19350 [Rhizobium helianthi]|uniref:Uncharacterized protein n=1 Tax=Rhizobium helianthi TaxID=1132695 RepID=A0ABW4M9Z9_9HYPH
MFPTAFTHGITQFARTLSLPERLYHSPARNMALEGLRRRNTALDSFFYDVKVVNAEEAFYISSCLAAEGAILIVPPTDAGQLRLCDTVDDFIQNGGATVDTLAVAGVGSSALGSAALGRNIADATGKPVAVVISGYGLADAVTESLGGYFLFGQMNSVRHAFEQLDEFFGRPQFGIATRLSSEKLCQGSLDTQTIRALLLDSRLSFRLIVAHSKGNLVISEALYDLAENEKERARQLAESIKIVTISARIAMPPLFTDVVDVMGEWDWFGDINSLKGIPADEIVPHAFHHTNTEVPNHVPVTEVLRKILSKGQNAGTGTPEEIPAPITVQPVTAYEEAVEEVAEPAVAEVLVADTTQTSVEALSSGTALPETIQPVAAEPAKAQASIQTLKAKRGVRRNPPRSR